MADISVATTEFSHETDRLIDKPTTTTNSMEEKKSCCVSSSCSKAKDKTDPTETDAILANKSASSTDYGAIHEPTPVQGRSQFHLKGICCTSEIPAVKAIVQPLPGVSEVTVNTSTKMLYVRHEPHVSSAQAILDALNTQHIGAQIVKDIGENLARNGSVTEGRSQFHIKELCCSSDVPKVKSIVEALPGVSDIKVNIPAKMIYVRHNTLLSSARYIMNALIKEQFGASIVKDAAVTTKERASTTSTVGRSQFHVKEICCASEIPQLRSIVEPIPGVAKVTVNTPAKMVYVNHDTLISSAQDIADALNKERFGAKIIKDAAANGHVHVSSNSNTVAEGRSQFHVQEICCASEIPQIKSIVEPIPGVTEVTVNTPAKMVYVTHDTFISSAQDIANALNAQRFGAEIVKDANKEARNQNGLPTHVRSQFHVKEICCASEIPRVKSIVEPIPGVTEVAVNTPAKMVYVKHDALVSSAQDIANALNGERFGADIVKDGGAARKTRSVKSVLSFQGREAATAELEDFLSSSFDNHQMVSFVVDIPAKEIVVMHDPFLLSAEQIQLALWERTGMQTVVTIDGAKAFPNIQNEHEQVMEENFVETMPRPAVIASGILWFLSLLSVIGGNL